MKIAGIDIGTTACKVSVYEDTGRLVRECEREYPINNRVSPTEIDMNGLFDTVCAVLRGIAEVSDGLGAI